jgi:hypothetical protein
MAKENTEDRSQNSEGKRQKAEDRGQKSEVRSQKGEVGEMQTAPATDGDLAAENAALKARITAMEAAKSRLDGDEILIAAKMAKGLRREQARAVINRQREFDGRKQQQIKN